MKIRRLGVAVILATSALLIPGALPGAASPSTTADTVVASSPGKADTAAAPTTSRDEPRPPAGYKSKYAKVNGFNMHYLRGGSGSPIVLLHGFPQTSAEWTHQLGPLAEDHTVIAVDLRGAGDSGVPKDGYDGVQLARDVHALLTQLGLNDGIQIVAHDVGIWAAYPYAAMWPSEVERMAVMEAPIPDETIFQGPAITADGSHSAWHFGFFQEELAEKLIAGQEREFVEGFIGLIVTEPDAFSPEEYEYYARFLREPGRLKAWMEVYRALPENAAQNKQLRAKGKLTMPILAIGGEKLLGASVGDQWKKYATNVEGVVFPGAGHWITEEQPEELTQMLREFLR